MAYMPRITNSRVGSVIHFGQRNIHPPSFLYRGKETEKHHLSGNLIGQFNIFKL